MNDFIKMIETLFHSGMGGTYAMVLIIMSIYGYFKLVKPYLTSFETMENIIDLLPKKIEQLERDINNLEKIIIQNHDEVINNEKELFKDFVIGNDKTHQSIVVDLNRLREVIQLALDGNSNLNTKNEESFKNILIELVKLESRIDILNSNGFRGLQK